MNIKNITYSLLKIIAVWIFINSFIPNFMLVVLNLIESFYVELDISSTRHIFWFLHVITYLFVAIALWFGANKISDLITNGLEGKEQLDDEPMKLRNDELLDLGIILIGLYVLITQIPYLFNHIISFFAYSDFSINVIDSKFFASAVQTIVSLVLAFYFIFSRENIFKLILKIRKL